MTTKACGGRKHTPITTEKQQGFFGAELARRKAGKKGRAPGITKEELRSHLKESKGKFNPVVSPCLVGAGEAMKETFYKKGLK